VVGVPDTAVGEVVWAYVALRERQSATAAEIQEFAKTKIAPYKVPEEIHFLEVLPKGPTGKVHRRTLREQAIRRKDARITP
jgi:long-chain acyl-CoA synthetase